TPSTLDPIAADAIAAEYIQISETSRQKLWGDLIEQMEARLSQVRMDLEESRERLHEHEAAEGISTAFSPLLTGAGTSLGGSQYMVSEVPQAVAQLKTGIMQMEVELGALKESFSDSDPNVVKLERQIAASKRRLLQETEEAVEKYNKQFGLTRVAAEVVFNQQLYSSLVTKHEELKAQHIMQNKSPEIIETAIKPLYPSKPNRKLIFMTGMAMGCLIGLGLALLQEYMDSSMHRAEDVTEFINIPVLGRTPRFSRAIYRLRRSNANPGKKSLINYEDSSRNRRAREFYRESYRMLQLELMAAASEKLGREAASIQHQNELTLLMTSSVTGEGSSVVAMNLAISIAQTGRKVLLVNANSRSSVHCELLDLSPQTGLIDILMGSAEWADAVKETTLDNLHVITAGDENGQSDLSSLLISSRLEDFIESVRKQFDVTIFDSSSAISTSESAAIGSRVDGVVLVIKADGTRKDAILQAKQRIQSAGGNVLGAVLNSAKIGKKYYK
ncbi:polysaccharide biosynthesis tyrosine autokinase, partial [Candidatus Poribacteria bacterium]